MKKGKKKKIELYLTQYVPNIVIYVTNIKLLMNYYMYMYILSFEIQCDPG